MKVLVVGGGGREHALCWGLARSPRVTDLVAAPGNAGIAELARVEPGVDADDVEAIVALAERERPDLVVIGPEAPLVAGLADALRDASSRGVRSRRRRAPGSRVRSPSRRTSWSQAGVPTARAASFTEVAPALAFVDELGGRAVVKADGLAAGKGVTVATDRDEARGRPARVPRGARVRRGRRRPCWSRRCSKARRSRRSRSSTLGSVVPLALSQDFKRIGEGDTGPNTGGMGAYSPLPWVDAATERRIWAIVGDTVDALRARGITYRGLLYTGLMLTADGPKVLEYNCRFGDPETEVVIPRLESDLADLLEAAALDRLAEIKVALHDDAAVTVVLASGGYPGSYETGVPIAGLDDAAQGRGGDRLPCGHRAARRYSDDRRGAGAGGHGHRRHDRRGSSRRVRGRRSHHVRGHDVQAGHRGAAPQAARRKEQR